VIVRYADHAANERTFLAWVRTALAVVAFGGILARPDLFRIVAGRPHGAATHARYGVMTDAGLVCVAIGIVLFAAAYQRFRRTRAEIGREDAGSTQGSAMETLLAVCLAAIGIAFLAALAGVG
jgi:putative membrane protein